MEALNAKSFLRALDPNEPQYLRNSSARRARLPFEIPDVGWLVFGSICQWSEWRIDSYGWRSV